MLRTVLVAFVLLAVLVGVLIPVLMQLRSSMRNWQGLADRTVSPEAGRALAAAIPDCRARFLEGEAHLLMQERFEEIMIALAEGW